MVTAKMFARHRSASTSGESSSRSSPRAAAAAKRALRAAREPVRWSIAPAERRNATEDAHALTNPTLLAEVLSPATAAYDRGQKFDHYQQIPSLRQFLLVDSERRHVDLYTRLEDGRWAREGFSGGAIPLLSVDVTLDFDALYVGWEEERAIDG